MKHHNHRGSDVFWGEMAPCDHLLHIYEDDIELLKGVERFVTDGFKSNESVVIIATSAHLEALEKLLKPFDLSALRLAEQYISLDAEEFLNKFMVNGWPDDALFAQSILKVLKRARRNGRRARAFGEMVALLWAQGHNGATVRLEHLWQELCKKENFPLLCSYPKTGFTDEASASVQKICLAHSRMVPSFV